MNLNITIADMKNFIDRKGKLKNFEECENRADLFEYLKAALSGTLDYISDNIRFPINTLTADGVCEFKENMECISEFGHSLSKYLARHKDELKDLLKKFQELANDELKGQLQKLQDRLIEVQEGAERKGSYSYAFLCVSF